MLNSMSTLIPTTLLFFRVSMKVAVHFSVVIFAALFASSVDTSFAQITVGPDQFGDC